MEFIELGIIYQKYLSSLKPYFSEWASNSLNNWRNYLMVEFDVIISKTRRGQLYHISGTDISTLVYYNTMFPFHTSEQQIYI